MVSSTSLEKSSQGEAMVERERSRRCSIHRNAMGTREACEWRI
jgi:hypothetical protein